MPEHNTITAHVIDVVYKDARQGTPIGKGQFESLLRLWAKNRYREHNPERFDSRLAELKTIIRNR